MLSSYRTPSRHRQWKPGRRGGRKGLLLQGLPRPWPVAKARTFGAPAAKYQLAGQACQPIFGAVPPRHFFFIWALFLQALHPWSHQRLRACAHRHPRLQGCRAFRAPRKRPFRPLAQQELAVSPPQRRPIRSAMFLRGPRPASSPCAGGHPQCKAFGQEPITSRQPCSGPFRPMRRRESSHPARLRPFLPAEDTLRRRAPLRSAPLVTGRL